MDGADRGSRRGRCAAGPNFTGTGVVGGRRKAARENTAPIDEKLRSNLREWRVNLAKEQHVPAYVILHDSTLDAICRQRPATMADLLEVPGIGERKAERFGVRILALVAATKAS